jgi:hypothetical protein
MASTTTLTTGTSTPLSTLLNISEAVGAAATETVDILALLTAAGFNAGNSPLFAGLSQAFTDQAAARSYFFANIDLTNYFTASSVGTSTTLFDANVSVGAVANNFRLAVTGVKAANGDTYTLKSRFALRHSIVR